MIFYIISSTDVLETFLNYVVKLEFDTTPDYDKCRKMFSDALTSANYPLDGKIDFASPKKAKKVGRTSIPVKRKSSSSPIKRKSAATKSKQTAEISSSDDDDDDDSFEVSKPSPKKSKSKTPAKKLAGNSNLPAKKASIANKVVMKDQGCQTSPAFVKAAKKQRKALSSKATSAAVVGANNPEMEEFAEMAINAAKKVSARGKKKSSTASAMASEAENNFGMENPTPAMLALMAKKAEADGAKKSKATKNKK